MTMIQSLPEEMLSMIFENLDKSSRKTCQNVCCAWYFLAHISFINVIDINGVPAINQFIDSIDYNPDPAYLKAVKSIRIATKADDDLFHLDDTLNQKLFYRFPNLQSVSLDKPSFLEHFNNDMCKTFLKNCPKLENFTVEKDLYPEEEYRDQVYKAKLLITTIDLKKFDNVSQYGDIAQYLGSFTRLKTILGEANTLLTNFKQLLQILQRAPNLTSVCMGSELDSTSAAETYLKSRPKDVQDMLINRLSKISSFEVNYKVDFCLGSFKFVLKYLPGLENIDLNSYYNLTWTEAHIGEFSELVSDLKRFKNHFIDFQNMDLNILLRCFAIVAQNVFTCSSEYKHLVVKSAGYADLFMSKNRSAVEVTSQLTLTGIAQHLLNTRYDFVEEFDLQLDDRSKPLQNNPTYFQIYNMILGQMPSLKLLTIDISTEFVDQIYMNDCGILLPQVEQLTIRSTACATFQHLLNSYVYVLPHLKHLTFYYYSGNWEEVVGEFRVKLPKYSLKSLQLDVTPVKTKTINILKKPIDGFFVLEVEVLNGNERHLFKVSFDLATVSRVSDSDLKGFIRGEDYYLVSMTIRNLEKLELFAYNGAYEEGREDYLYDIQNAMILKKTLLKDSQWIT